jgi:hypothetical protein
VAWHRRACPTHGAAAYAGEGDDQLVMVAFDMGKITVG